MCGQMCRLPTHSLLCFRFGIPLPDTGKLLKGRYAEEESCNTGGINTMMVMIPAKMRTGRVSFPWFDGLSATNLITPAVTQHTAPRTSARNSRHHSVSSAGMPTIDDGSLASLGGIAHRIRSNIR